MTPLEISQSLTTAHNKFMYALCGTNSAVAEKKLWSAASYIKAQLDAVDAQILKEIESEEVL